MKDTIFASMSYEKTEALLKEHTAAGKKEGEACAWKSPQNPNKEWACLVGKWQDNRFKGKIYRHYEDKNSGGIAMPRLTLKVDQAGNLGQIQMKAGLSISFWVFLAVLVFFTALQIIQIVVDLPGVGIVPVLVLIAWFFLCALMIVMFYNQYQHECQAIELTLKAMTKAFD